MDAISIIILFCLIAYFIYKKKKNSKQKTYTKYRKSKSYNSADAKIRNHWLEKQEFKGTLGESRTLNALDSSKGIKLYDLMLPNQYNKDTQLDIVFITKKAVYAIENKHYKGWIFGDQFSKQWTQSIYIKGKTKKYNFPNPIRQNWGHIQALKSILGPEIPIYSIITFSGDAELKNVKCSADDTYVIYTEDLMKTIDVIELKTTVQINDTEAASKLKPYIKD